MSQNARLTTTAEHSAITVLLLPNEIASGIPIKAITITLNGAAYFRCKATASSAVSAPRAFRAATYCLSPVESNYDGPSTQGLNAHAGATRPNKSSPPPH